MDSSGFYAALDRRDPYHSAAAEGFTRAEHEGWRLLTTNYIMHESWALVQRRLGWEAVDRFRDGLLPRCDLHWVDAETHARGADLCAARRERRFSLTDALSIVVMRSAGTREVLGDDAHFRREEFRQI